MATSPLGGFADLSPAYRQLAIRQAADQGLLGNLLGGLQQGIALEQLPQTLQDQAAIQQANVLNRTLANAINLQKLQDLQNPDAALARKLKEELTLKGLLKPETGVTLAPAGLQGEVIATPGALTPEQNASLSNAIAGSVLPTAAAGQPITPIGINGVQTGFNLDPQAAQIAENQITQNKINLANAKAKAAGVPIEYFDMGNGNLGYREKKSFDGQAPKITEAINQETGEPLKFTGKPGSSISGNKLLELNNEADKLAEFGLDKTLYTNPLDLQAAVNHKKDEIGRLDNKQSGVALRTVSELDRNPIIKAWKESQAKQAAAQASFNAFNNPNLPPDKKPSEANVDQTLLDAYTSIVTGRSPTIAQVKTSKDFVPLYQRVEATAQNWLGLRESGSPFLPQARQGFINAINEFVNGLENAAKPEIQAGKNRLNSSGVGISFYTGVLDPTDPYDAVKLKKQIEVKPSSSESNNESPSSAPKVGDLKVPFKSEADARKAGFGKNDIVNVNGVISRIK